MVLINKSKQMGDKRKMKLSRELDYRIRYDVEHDLFHAQNVFNDEYITPTFVEYVQKLEKENAVLEKRTERAKECMKKLLFIINSDPANYNCKGLVQDAEDFIYNRTCNIRQQGQHCISETRCIMCDKEIKENE